MSVLLRVGWLKTLALVCCVALLIPTATAQTDIDVDVQGYLCNEPNDAQAFQQLAATSPDMSRASALWRFNRTREEPRCRWYERTHMIFKGALRKDVEESEVRAKYLFIGGAGGIFEVLVYETPDGAETLYSWRRTYEDAG